ncbi:DUF7115 domain-containing protein [Natrarchaeobaculum sulfurireducens]|uniref:DUF7115 domain-containing protein n=1 Tax=Natrarchaeobaculum sulfurireducens TaxID=2044521 RepID=A0A346PES7_9EURY|nr:hypothetical protein [Natrarchaeobaculum sulfurireducens]AXR78022.1 hypothetical protein AArc1_1693 [Natrarchaeobaculum sulfurireducens]
MSVPGIVQSTLDNEEIAARVSLGGEDELFVTPTRTLVYRADGLLSDESVDEYPHDADRLTLSEGRRKTKFTLEYPLEGTEQFTIPAKKTERALHPVLAGVLNGNEITDPGETVVQTYRFSELTLILTSERLVKHIGGAVWDGDYEEFHFGDVTNLSFEDGSVATQIVLEVDGRPQRIKAPNEEAADLRERLQRALFEYHDVDSLEEFNALVDDEDDTDDGGASMDFGDGVEPLSADPPELEVDGERTSSNASVAGESAVTNPADAETNRPGSHSGGPQTWAETEPTVREDEPEYEPDSAEPVEPGDVFETADVTTETDVTDAADAISSGADPALLERIERLEDAVDRQTDLIEAQQETIEQLIDELRQGR